MIDFLFGFGCGALSLVQFTWFAHKRYIKRLNSIDAEERITQEFERRRDAIDSGRTDEVRADAGPAAELGGLFEIRPGAMTLGHLQEKKISEAVDTQQD